MYKRGGHVHGAASQRRPAPSPSSSPSLLPSPSPSSSPAPSPSSNPQQAHADGQRGQIGLSSHPEQDIRGQLRCVRSASSSAPSPSTQHWNDEGNAAEEDIRFMISPFGDSFQDATYVVRQLNKIINNFWMGQWITYSSAPKEVKDLWWNEFKRKFRWEETKEDEVKRIFKKKTGDHIRNVMNKARTRQVKPDFITGDNWTGMKRTWENEKNKQRSEQNKKNRVSSSGQGSATYAGGSINIGEHKTRMAKELGAEPTYAATFERTFQKKDKTWIGDRAKAIKDKYDELVMTAATGTGGDGVDGSEPLVDTEKLWVEASGGMKGGKIYGMGSMARLYTTKAGTTSSSKVAASSRARRDEQVTQDLSELKYLLAEKDEAIRVVKQQYESLKSQKDEEIREVKQQWQSVQSQLQLVMQHLNLNQHQVPPVPPTNQIGHGYNAERHNDDEIAAADDDFDNLLID